MPEVFRAASHFVEIEEKAEKRQKKCAPPWREMRRAKRRYEEELLLLAGLTARSGFRWFDYTSDRACAPRCLPYSFASV